MELPEIGLGTWELRGQKCTDVVKLALDIGYRHLDTAYLYDNHEAIGKAIKNFDRSSLYLTSKIALEQQVDKSRLEESVRNACHQALRELGTDYLDLYLIHGPDPGYPLEQAFFAMEKLREEGKVRQVGVSNYHIYRLEDLRKVGATPYANQVEFHPYLYQKELLEYCKSEGIRLISYRPFGKGKLLSEEPLFSQIGERHHKSGAQVILRWLLQKGIPVIPKASSEKHLRDNFAIFDFSLTVNEQTITPLHFGHSLSSALDIFNSIAVF
jgi:diketogulonate reductase-like aldo/keto reductase